MNGASSLRQVAPHRLQVREGGGCLSLFGIPFFAAGVFLLLAVAGVVPIENAHEAPGGVNWILLGMGGIFSVVGGGFILGRRWVTLDRARGMIRKEWGLLVPARSEELPMKGYQAVLLTFDSGDSDSSDRYPVLLEGTRAIRDLPLTSPQRYGEAREQAAELAAFLKLPLVDRSTAHETVTTPDQVDLSFKARIQARLETELGGAERADGPTPDAEAFGSELPTWKGGPSETGRSRQHTRPREMVCRFQELGDRVEIERPGPPVRIHRIVGFVMPTGLLVYFGPDLLQFFRDTRTPEPVQAAILGFLVLLFVAIPLGGLVLGVLRSIRGGAVLTVSPREIVVEERGALRRTVRRLPAEDLLGVDYGTRARVMASIRQAAGSRAGGKRADPSIAHAAAPSGRPGRDPWWMSALRRLVPSQGIVLKTREDLVVFGAGLPDEEVAYLHSAVLRVLSTA